MRTPLAHPDLARFEATGIPLNRAAICFNCETVFPINCQRCPTCDGTACMPLETWIKTVKGEK